MVLIKIFVGNEVDRDENVTNQHQIVLLSVRESIAKRVVGDIILIIKADSNYVRTFCKVDKVEEHQGYSEIGCCVSAKRCVCMDDGDQAVENGNLSYHISSHNKSLYSLMCSKQNNLQQIIMSL